MEKRYEDQLLEYIHRDNVKCELRLQPNPKDEGRDPVVELISERLLTRLRHLALAYELPLLERLPSHGQITYPETQLSSVEDELAFLFDVTSDQVLHDAISPIREMIGRARYEPRGWLLIVEMP